MADFAALALKLISKHGRTVALQRDTGTVPSEPGKPWRPNVPVVVTTPTVAFFVDSTAADLLARVTAVSRLVLSTVETNTTVALVPGTIPVAPQIKHQIVDGTRTWEIKQVGKVEQGAKVALYVLELGN